MKSVKRMLAGWVLTVAGMVPGLAAAGITYYHNDIAGSPVVATNESGQVVWRESYRPYGERTVNSAAALPNKVWFTSRRQDAETGLVYMGARYYDPVVGRFVSKDPVGFDEGNLHSFNRYAYANNNPYRYKDPDGRVAETVFDAISFGISVAMFRNDPSLANFIGAAVDGIAMGVPFVPGGIGAIRATSSGADVGAGVLKGLPDAAGGAGRASKYQDITTGNSVANRATDLSRADFEKNLLEGGWSKTTSKDGKVSIFEKEGASYRVRDSSKEGSKTAEFFKPGSERANLKIRLGD